MSEIRKCYSYTVDLGYEEEPANVPSADDIREWVRAGFKYSRIRRSEAGTRREDTFTPPDAIGVEPTD